MLAFDIICVSLLGVVLIIPVAKKFASGNQLLFWGIVGVLIAVCIYVIFLYFLQTNFPRMSYLFHEIMAWLGVYMGFYIIIGVLGKMKETGGILSLVNNPIANKVIVYIFYAIIAIPIAKKRVEVFKNMFTHANKDIDEDKKEPKYIIINTTNDKYSSILKDSYKTQYDEESELSMNSNSHEQNELEIETEKELEKESLEDVLNDQNQKEIDKKII